ncbi:MAG: MBL fold metallo-hydrolase [Verrucomicrobia bacterium]|nr:MBL fold metallo-hydrolase [Verrucomicrobiota bacterium]
MIPLEDNFDDIIAKAKAGLGIRDGSLRGACIEHLAERLHLGLAALADRNWHPAPVMLPGLAMFSTRYGLSTVNAYIAHDASRAVAFDTGADPSPMLAFLRGRSLSLDLLLLTHSHPDHAGALHRMKTRAFISEHEPVQGVQPFPDGRSFHAGSLQIEARRTSGHSPGGTSYLVRGLSRLVIVTGDALFAGSIGGAPSAYEEALACIREQILSLPNDTIICPGHGPMTTVGEEKLHNPFFAL